MRSRRMTDLDLTAPPMQALDWAMRHRLGPLDESEAQDFEAWLAENPEHPALYADALRTQSLVRLAQVNLAPAPAAGTVTPFPEMGSARPPPPMRSRRWVFGGAAGLAASIALGAIVVPPLLGRSYRTAVGERRMVTLADGSTVNLNGASEIRVRFSDDLRSLEL